MRTEIRYCKQCRQDTRHDVFKDGLAIGEEADKFERVFFGIFTLGASELLTDRWRQCQRCDTKHRIT
jgi:hypothetical protein